jgi:hypothetical protein
MIRLWPAGAAAFFPRSEKPAAERRGDLNPWRGRQSRPASPDQRPALHLEAILGWTISCETQVAFKSQHCVAGRLLNDETRQLRLHRFAVQLYETLVEKYGLDHEQTERALQLVKATKPMDATVAVCVVRAAKIGE